MNRTSTGPLLPIPVQVACASHFMHGCTLGFYALMPVFVRSLDGSRATAGFIAGMAAGASILSRPLAGWLLDHASRRVTIWVGGVLATIAAALYLQVDSIGPLLIGARVLSGVADGLLFTAYFTVAADWVHPSRRVQGLAIFGLTGLIPMGFTPVLGEWVLNGWGFQALFASLVGAAAASLVLSVFLTGRKPPEFEAEARGSSASAKVTFSLAHSSWIAGTLGLAMCCAFNFVPDAAREAGVAIGAFTVPYGVVAGAIRILAGRIPDRVGAHRVVGPALACYGAGMVLLALWFNSTTVILAGSLGGIGHGMTFPALAALGANRVPVRQRGRAMALLTGVMELMVFAPAWPLGRLADRAGGYPVLFAVGGALIVAAAGAWMAMLTLRASPHPRRPG